MRRKPVNPKAQRVAGRRSIRGCRQSVRSTGMPHVRDRSCGPRYVRLFAVLIVVAVTSCGSPYTVTSAPSLPASTTAQLVNNRSLATTASTSETGIPLATPTPHLVLPTPTPTSVARPTPSDSQGTPPALLATAATSPAAPQAAPPRNFASIAYDDAMKARRSYSSVA